MNVPPGFGESSASSANFGFETKLWRTADKLGTNMDAAEYKHVVSGLIVREHISSVRSYSL